MTLNTRTRAELLEHLDALRPYLRHRVDCDAVKGAPEPWLATPCTCTPARAYGDHNLGCPRAEAFRRAMTEHAPSACSCGLDAALGGAK